jgi:hypothetical protein
MNKLLILLMLVFLIGLAGCAQATPTSPQSLQVNTTPLVTIAPTDTVVATTDKPTTAPTETAVLGPWSVERQMNVFFSVNVAGFLDDAFGIAVGDGGAVHYTRDGGQTWLEAQNSSLCRYALDILDEQVAWHCGNSGSVGLSVDGGKTWQKVGNYGGMEPDHCLHVSFPDTSTGWAATASTLGATNDGGKSWVELTLPKDFQRNILAIYLRTASDGYLLDAKGTFWVTTDAGKTWSANSLGLKEKERLFSNAPNAAIRFSDANHGMLVAILMIKGQKVVAGFHTEDGGQTWQWEQIPGLTWASFFLARDGASLTAVAADEGKITVLRYQQP